MGQFFATEVAAGHLQGRPYAVPWFDNPEGLFYRTDLIKTPPTSPAQVVSDAEAAMKADKSLKEGIAFEGEKYEGAITAFMTVDGAFGGKLNRSSVNTAGNVAGARCGCTTPSTSEQDRAGGRDRLAGGKRREEFTAGNAAFAINYPFVASTDASQGGPAKGNVGYIPFPAAPGGTAWVGARRRDAGDQRQDRRTPRRPGS